MVAISDAICKADAAYKSSLYVSRFVIDSTCFVDFTCMHLSVYGLCDAHVE